MSISAMIRRLEITWNQLFGDIELTLRQAYISEDSAGLASLWALNRDMHESELIRIILRKRLRKHSEQA